jgi:hypothetical protein
MMIGFLPKSTEIISRIWAVNTKEELRHLSPWELVPQSSRSPIFVAVLAVQQEAPPLPFGRVRIGEP